MKNLFKTTLLFSRFLILITLFLFSSCKKEKVLEMNLSGTWELGHSVGGFTMGRSPNYPPGNGDIIVFNGKNFQKFYSGKLHAEGTFNINRVKIPNKKDEFTIVYFTDKSMFNSVFTLNKNTLIFYPPDNVADAPVNTYVRISGINNQKF